MSNGAADIARSSALTVARRLSVLIVALAAVASAGGLALPGLYRDTAWVVPQNRGTDFVTLCVALPALCIALRASQRGSVKGIIIWFGLVGYMCYVYAGASFAYAFNEFFLIYVALLGLSIATLVALGRGIDPRAVQSAFDAGTPRRGAAGFSLLLAVMLCVLWLGQIVPFLTSGTIPTSITLSGGLTMFVYVLDLGIIVPVAVLAAVWLRRGLPWGSVLAGFILIKAATMGLSLVSMTWFAVRAGQSVDTGLAVLWIAIAASGLGLSVWFLRHCRGRREDKVTT